MFGEAMYLVSKAHISDEQRRAAAERAVRTRGPEDRPSLDLSNLRQLARLAKSVRFGRLAVRA
ncbi:MAG TPA: hypothetical protein VKR30_05050 [Candidatus Limnocylindrales bacterium]|nr:hypothetical protein [Candidatus Limnocylindrales bacterium]